MILTNSSGPLIENATDDRAGAISTSSTSLDISPNSRFHSSANGPDAASFGSVPTLSYNESQHVLATPIFHHTPLCALVLIVDTYPGTLDDIQTLFENRRSLLGIFGCDEDLHRNLTTFEKFEMLCCSVAIISTLSQQHGIESH